MHFVRRPCSTLPVTRDIRSEDLPLVSVIIPTYNAVGTTGEQLVALAAQDYPRRSLSLSAIRRGRWVSLVALFIGHCEGSIRHRVLYF